MARYCLDCKDPIEPDPGQTKRRDRCPACNELALVLLGIEIASRGARPTPKVVPSGSSSTPSSSPSVADSSSDAMTATEPRPLTDQQRKVLTAIVTFWGEHQRPPSIREICDALGFSGPNAITYHMKALVRKGFIRMGHKEARSIEVVALTDSVAIIAANYLKTLKG
ncbi:MAG: hypothetical protein C0467_06000 [Planctomycetaceae bacterium]|nr:hypothetical protein [Planctomycetaceae bacterium]